MKNKKYALYARISTFEQNIDIQKTNLINYAIKNNLDYDYFGEIESTRKTRPIKQRLMILLKNNEYDGVIVTNLDRWSRDLKEMVSSINNLLVWNIDFISIGENIDFKTQSGQEFIKIYGIFAEIERKRISERTKEALYYKKMKGQTIGRPKGSKDKTKRKTDGYYKRQQKIRVENKLNDFTSKYGDILNGDELGNVEKFLDILPYLMIKK